MALTLIIAMCVLLVACEAKRESAQSVVEGAITSVKNYDKEGVSKYFKTDPVSDNKEPDKQADEVTKLIVSGIKYEVVSSKEDEASGTAIVTVNITNTDMNKIMAEFTSEMFSNMIGYAFLPEDKQPSDEELNQMYLDKLTELMQNTNKKEVTNKVDVKFSLSENKWVVEPSKEFSDALLGGISSFTDAMNNAFGEQDGEAQAEQ